MSLQGRSEEGRVRRIAEKQTPVLESASPVFDPVASVIGVVIVFQDISSLKELEQLREEWTSIIAHDLRQPVTTILGYAGRLGNLLAHQGSAEAETNAVEHVASSARNLNRMIADLLDLSRIEARRLTLKRELTDLPALVRAVVERYAAITQGHPVRVEIPGDLPPVEVDPGRIEQVLDNLLSNAAKYGYPNTEIHVEVKRQRSKVTVSVTNRGEGISPEELPRLFDRFYRIRAAQAGPVAGLGLGLYITKGLVEAHGGRIWAESVPAQTTTFRFSLPISS